MKIVQLTTDNREHYRDYASKDPAFGAAPEALLEGFAELPGVEVHVISCLRQPVQSPAKLAPNIHYHSVTVGRRGWMSTAYASCVLQTRRLIHEIAPDLVHGQGTERDCALSAVYSGFPNVVTIHGNMAELHRLGLHGYHLFGALASRLETHALRKTAGVFCNSRYTMDLVAPRSRRTWHVPNPIRSEFFAPQPNGARSGEPPTLLNVGLVTPRKRQLEILREIVRLNQRGHAAKIIFVGGLSEQSEYGAAFSQELRNAGRMGCAEYAGFLDRSGLIRLMDQCDGFIHFPSEEAFGLVVAEALARGLKFFGADLGGIRDIASGIEGAELLKGFPDLGKALENWIQAGAHGLPNAPARIASLYHPKIIAERHVEIYREVLGR